MADVILSYVDYCKAFIKDELDNFEGIDVIGCDLAQELTMDANMNGSITFSTYQASLILKEWWDELEGINSRIYDELGFTHDDVDVFDTPEKYHVIAVIEGVSSILDGLEIIQENWDNNIELTRDVIDTIIEQIDGVYAIRF